MERTHADHSRGRTRKAADFRSARENRRGTLQAAGPAQRVGDCRTGSVALWKTEGRDAEARSSGEIPVETSQWQRREPGRLGEAATNRGPRGPNGAPPGGA